MNIGYQQPPHPGPLPRWGRGRRYAAADDQAASGAKSLQDARNGFAQFAPRHTNELRRRARSIEQGAKEVENSSLPALGAKLASGRDVLKGRMITRSEEEDEMVLAQKSPRFWRR